MKCIRPICTSLTYQIQGAKSIYVNVRIGKKCKRTVKLTKSDNKYFLTNTYVSCSITLMFKVYILPSCLSSTILLHFLFLKFNLPCHTQRKSHLCHKEYDRRTSITDKRKSDTCIRHKVYNNRNIKNNLQCYVNKNPTDHK